MVIGSDPVPPSVRSAFLPLVVALALSVPGAQRAAARAGVSAGAKAERRVGEGAPAGSLDEGAAPIVAGDEAAADRRRAASLVDRARLAGPRDTRDLALDAAIVGPVFASSAREGSGALDAVDGDEGTAGRGAKGARTWSLTLPFVRPVHLGLVRVYFGDSATLGVPGRYHWERLNVDPRLGCVAGGAWRTLRGGVRDDGDPNTFVNGPVDVHARRQIAFFDADACGLRLVVDAMTGPEGPVVRSLRLLEGAASVARDARVVEGIEGAQTPLDGGALTDGDYATFWRPSAGTRDWSLTFRLAAVTQVDRVSLVLGYDAASLPLEGRPGRRYVGAEMPVGYTLETNPDDDPSHWVPVDEARVPHAGGREMPLRRRLIRLRAPRPVRALRLRIAAASGPWGEEGSAGARPIVRDVGVYAASDPRPVVREPLFLSVDANPARLTSARPGGAANADGQTARDVYHRLRRVVADFDSDTRWPAEASRPRTDGSGRFLEVIEGDDPLLDADFLAALSPPPVVLLSGSLDWEFDLTTSRSAAKPGHWQWGLLARADDPDAGMGQLIDAVRRRVAPFVGFCGGGQMLALFEAAGRLRDERDPRSSGFGPIDAVLVRNDNAPVRGLLTRKEPYERAWWYDGPATDPARPRVHFDPVDPVFEALAGEEVRRETRELPTSHGDTLRPSAFAPGGPLDRFAVAATSEFCRPWVDPAGPEPTSPDPADPSRHCLRVVQAFHSRAGEGGYPVVGFQFHPEQRDFRRLAPGSPPEARGDALNALADAIDLALEGYLRAYWPGA